MTRKFTRSLFVIAGFVAYAFLMADVLVPQFHLSHDTSFLLDFILGMVGGYVVGLVLVLVWFDR